MFAKYVLSLPVVLVAACAEPRAPAPPIAVASANAAQRVADCEGKGGPDEWHTPAQPGRIHGSTYYVGTCGLAAVLIATPAGHILIDGTVPEAAATVAGNIEKLGFKVEDVRYLLATHEHFDHAGGLSAIQQRSGGTGVALDSAAAVLASGHSPEGDPQFGRLPDYPGLRIGRIVKDGGQVELGGVALTAFATPGHAPGGTSWTWTSCEGDECVPMVYADSVTSVSADSYRYSDHPGYVAAFRRSLDKIAALPCAILIAPHPGSISLFERIAGQAPLIDRAACHNYAAGGRKMLDERLAKEAAG